MHISDEQPLQCRPSSEPGRYDFEAPAESGWAEKSAYLLRPRKNDQAVVLEAFGLAAPIAREDVVAFLRAAYPQPATLDEIDEMFKAYGTGLAALPLGPGEHGTVANLLWFPSDHRPLCLLASTAGEIADDLNVTVWDATLYLLADVPAMVPWVTIKHQGRRFGDAVTIHVGSPAVTGDEIAKAYNEAKYQQFGARPPRQVGVNDLAIFDHETDCRRQGLTWEESWELWRRAAEQIGATPYNDVVAYRNKINDLRKRFEWMRDVLDEWKRPTGRPRKTTRKEVE